MQLYLIRHAQSQNNALPEHDRVEDPGLTEIGDQQAKLLGEWIPQLELTRLITSPFRRTLLTTVPIQQATSLVPEVRTDLHEQGGCYGGHEIDKLVGRPGMNRLEIEAEFSGYRVASDIDGDGWWKSQPYETRSAALDRAVRLLKQTIREFARTDERIAYVMHADIKLLFLKQLHAESLDVPYNTSITKLDFTPDTQSLIDFNQISHLTTELLTS